MATTRCGRFPPLRFDVLAPLSGIIVSAGNMHKHWRLRRNTRSTLVQACSGLTRPTRTASRTVSSTPSLPGCTTRESRSRATGECCTRHQQQYTHLCLRCQSSVLGTQLDRGVWCCGRSGIQHIAMDQKGRRKASYGIGRLPASGTGWVKQEWQVTVGRHVRGGVGAFLLRVSLVALPGRPVTMWMPDETARLTCVWPFLHRFLQLVHWMAVQWLPLPQRRDVPQQR